MTSSLRQFVAKKTELLALLLVFIAGCNSGDATAPAQQPVWTTSPPAAVPVGETAVVLPDGFRVIIEVAADDVSRAQGLMYRESVPKGRGMLFMFPETGVYPFWMKNTLVPLDILWIDANRRVVSVAAAVPPCSSEPCTSYPPAGAANFVLELAAGEAAAHKLKAGDEIRFEGLENITAR